MRKRYRIGVEANARKEYIIDAGSEEEAMKKAKEKMDEQIADSYVELAYDITSVRQEQ